MSAEPTITSFEHNGFNITSNAATQAENEAAFKGLATKSDDSGEIPDDATDGGETAEGDDVSKAASALGKLGAAAREAKRAELKAKPIPAKPAPAAPAPKKAIAAPADDDDPTAAGERAKAAAADDISKAPPEKRKQLASERVGEATRAAAEAKRALASERAERERISQELNSLRREREQRTAAARDADSSPAAPATPAAKAAPAPRSSEPKADDYPDLPSYVKAQALFEAEAAIDKRMTQEKTKAEAESRDRARDEAIARHLGTFNGRIKASGPDFLTRIGTHVTSLQPSYARPSGEPLTAHHVIADEIIASESSPDLMVHFSDHPEDLQRIAALQTPRDISREMAKLEARLEAARTTAQDAEPDEDPEPEAERGATAVTPPPKPAVSRAKPPATKVQGAPVAESGGYREGMTLDDYAREWQKRNKPATPARR